MAIVVKDCCKKLNSISVLSDLNLNVQQGTIYGLIGPSGCGKSMLLSCILGLRSFNSGNISVFGRNPGDKNSVGVIGFMPQESAIFPVFKVKEMLFHYGKLFGMRNEDIQERTKFLSIFLQLPDSNRLVQLLPGDDLRKVSLAVALLHKPSLLILDEPTVGMDPLLSQSIWDSLSEMVKSGTNNVTVLFTTNSLEESKPCDTIGYMSQGRLLCEETPASLAARFNTIKLEEAILNLCRQDQKKLLKVQKTQRKTTDTVSFHKNASDVVASGDPTSTQAVKLNGVYRKFSLKDDPKEIIISRPTAHSLSSGNWNIIFTLAKKNFLLSIRRPVLFAAQFLIPVLQLIIFNTFIGMEPVGLNVAYSSQDWNLVRSTSVVNNHTDLIQYCNSNSTGCFDSGLAAVCDFLKQFPKGELNFISETSPDNSLHLMQRGDAMTYISFPRNFTSNFQDRLLLRQFADNATLFPSTISVRMDVTDALSSLWLIIKLLTRLMGFMKDVINCLGGNSRLAEMPFKFGAIYGTADGQEWIQYMYPGLILVSICILGALPGAAWLKEKKLGIINREIVSGVRFLHVLVATLISGGTILIMQIGSFGIFLATVGMKVEGSVLLAIALVLLTGLAGLSFGFLCATILTSEVQMLMVQLLFSVTLFFCSGVIWPPETSPMWYRPLTHALPTTLPVMALRAVMFRGWGPTSSTVSQGFAVSFTWILLPLLLSVFLNGRKK